MIPGRRPIIWTLAATIAAGLALAACWVILGREPTDAFAVLDPVAEATRPGALFAGSRACRECHPGEYAAYGGSGHAHTLAPAAESRLAVILNGRSVEDPDHPGVSWSYALEENQFLASREQGGEVQRFVLDYALGSGRHAGTFVSLTDPVAPAGVEHRFSYYASDGALAVTPGQRSGDDLPGILPQGRELTTRDTLRCFGCHATPADGILRTAAGKAPLAEPGRLIPNVSCERCHGPGLAHVQAARSGIGTFTMPFGIGPAAPTSAAQLGLCGQCHRHPARFPREKIRSDDPSLARFQPIGLSQSVCYLKSAGALSCTTCHDPHFRASTDRARYDRACLNCHEGAGKTPCRTGRTESCVDCHMPKVDSGQRVLFTDHWIRSR